MKERLIKTIHVGIRQLKLTELEYRALYEGATGKTSLRDMSDSELEKVLLGLKRHGFTVTPNKRSVKPSIKQDAPYIRKIRSQWLTLRDFGVLRDVGEDALWAFVENQTGTKKEDLSPGTASKAIEILKKWILRVEPKNAA